MVESMYGDYLCFGLRSKAMNMTPADEGRVVCCVWLLIGQNAECDWTRLSVRSECAFDRIFGGPDCNQIEHRFWEM